MSHELLAFALDLVEGLPMTEWTEGFEYGRWFDNAAPPSLLLYDRSIPPHMGYLINKDYLKVLD